METKLKLEGCQLFLLHCVFQSEENALPGVNSLCHAGCWAAADPCLGERLGLALAWRAGH